MSFIARFAIGFAIKRFPIERVVAYVANYVMQRITSKACTKAFLAEMAKGTSRALTCLSLLSMALEDGVLSENEIVRIRAAIYAWRNGNSVDAKTENVIEKISNK